MKTTFLFTLTAVLLASSVVSAAVREGEGDLSPWAMAIRFYQKYISDLRYGDCYFDPSCSQYGLEAIHEKGLFLGSVLTSDRLIRCNGSAENFYGRGPDGRLSDPVSGSRVPKASPEVPSWLVPAYDEAAPFPEEVDGVSGYISQAGDTTEAQEAQETAEKRQARRARHWDRLRENAGFADALSGMGYCDRAATEYLRVAYLGRTNELQFWARMRIGRCLYCNRAWSAAASEFRKGVEFGPSSGDRNFAYFMAAGSAFNALGYDECGVLLDGLDFSGTTDGAICLEAGRVGTPVTREHELFLGGLLLMAREDWEGAAERFELVKTMCPGSPNLKRAEILAARAGEGPRLSHRSPGVAAVFSTIVPGTGQIYSGRLTDGMRHLIFEGLLIYTVYWLARDENYTGAYLVAGFTLPFYVGNIVGAGRSAEWFNSATRSEHIQAAIRAAQ